MDFIPATVKEQYALVYLDNKQMIFRLKNALVTFQLCDGLFNRHGEAVGSYSMFYRRRHIITYAVAAY